MQGAWLPRTAFLVVTSHLASSPVAKRNWSNSPKATEKVSSDVLAKMAGLVP